RVISCSSDRRVLVYLVDEWERSNGNTYDEWTVWSSNVRNIDVDFILRTYMGYFAALTEDTVPLAISIGHYNRSCNLMWDCLAADSYSFSTIPKTYHLSF